MACHTTQRGYVLLTVVATLFMVAAIVLLLNRESAMGVYMVASEAQTDRALYVAEAGFNHALWQTSDSICTAYPNPLIANFGAHSYTVSVTPTSGSPVSMAVTGTLAGGASSVIRRNRIRIYAPSTSMDLQLGTSPGKDTYIDDGPQADENYGSFAKMRVTNVINGQQHALLYFDVSNISSAAIIVSVILELNLEELVSDAPGLVNVHLVTQSWSGDLATWNHYDGINSWVTPGGDFNQTVIASTGVDETLPGPRQWDVTSSVSSWVSNSATNLGLLLAAEFGVNSATFTSSEGATQSQRPKLIITYLCECGVDCSGGEG